jgi:hypothetical protein
MGQKLEGEECDPLHTDHLSLYHEVSARGYEASIIGTYALSFQFYERVVLRRLQASGCKHNILLADAGQCGQELASGEGKPHFCGADYALLPIRSTGAFHPKFILLLGRRRSRLVIGSHNLTVAGFGLNREVTTALDIESAGATIQAAREVWRFVRAWTSKFPPRIQDIIGATERVAPWLGVRDHEQSPEQRVLCALPTGPSLWQQLRPVLSEPVKRIYILSPYFDSKLGFVQTLEKELNPKELVLAIHPTFSDLSSDARSLVSRCRFVDVTQFGDEWVEQYLHAKIYRFEFAGGKSIVVSGSANASEPAWLGSRGTRNAEMIVVQQAADRTWEQLGLSRLTQLPEVSQAGWESIRLRTKDKPERKDRSFDAPYLATVTPEGFMVDVEFTIGVSEAISKLGDADLLKIQTFAELKGLGRAATGWEDLLNEAILQTLTGADDALHRKRKGKRRWDKTVDFVTHLTGAMQSLDFHWKEQSNKRKTYNASELTTCGAEGQELSPIDNIASGEPTADEYLIEKEDVARKEAWVLQGFRKDAEATIVLQDLFSGMDKDEIMSKRSLTRKQYEAIMKRIRLKIISRRVITGGEEHDR